jgi:hypothetical protein
MRKIFNSVTAIYNEARAQEKVVRTGTWREQIQAGIVLLLGACAIGTAIAASVEILEAYDFTSISGVLPSQVEYILLTIGTWQAASYIRELKVKTTMSA